MYCERSNGISHSTKKSESWSRRALLIFRYVVLSILIRASFLRGEKNIAPLRRNVLFKLAEENVRSHMPLLNLQGQRVEKSQTDFQPIWNSSRFPSYSKHAPAGPVEF